MQVNSWNKSEERTLVIWSLTGDIVKDLQITIKDKIL